MFIKKKKIKWWENVVAIQKNSAFMVFIPPSALFAAVVVVVLPAIKRLALCPAQCYLVDEASSNRYPGRKGGSERGEGGWWVLQAAMWVKSSQAKVAVTLCESRRHRTHLTGPAEHTCNHFHCFPLPACITQNKTAPLAPHTFTLSWDSRDEKQR